MRLHPDDSEMLGQRKDDPVAEVAMKRDQRALLLNGPLKNQCIVRPGMTSFESADNDMSRVAQ